VLQVRRHYRSVLVAEVRGSAGGGDGTWRKVMQPVAESRLMVQVTDRGVFSTSAVEALVVYVVSVLMQLLLQQLLHSVIATSCRRRCSSRSHGHCTLGCMSGRLTMIGLG